MDLIWLALLGVGYLLYKKHQATIQTVAAASAAVASDPAAQQTIAQQVTQSTQVVAYNIHTGQTEINVAGAAAVGAIGALGSAAAASTTGTLVFSATAWTIVGGIVAGIFTLIAALRSDTHLYANEIVQKYENPFGQQVIAAYQQLQAATGSGSMSSVDAASLTNAVVTGWANYQAVMNQFQARGGDWNIVATQSLQNLDSAKGEGGTFNLNPALPKTALGNGWMTAVIQQMTAWTQQLQGEGL